MAEDLMRYDRLVEDALRGVVRRALLEVLANGLPGEHHFYITFRSQCPGVQMPDSLRATYPNEMTIVLQHQYWDLVIEEDRFAVSLSFNNIRHHLSIPFEAVVAFADPSVRFGLQFEYGDEGDEDGSESGTGDVLDSEESSNDDGAEPDSNGAATAADGMANDGTTSGDGATVVTLDNFRKK